MFTDRHGGVSRGSLRVGEPRRPRRRRSRRGRPEPGPRRGSRPGWATPTIGSGSTRSTATTWCASPPRSGAVPDADASVTTTVGLPLVILTADCAPLAIVADGAVAAVHAGWAGLEAGVVERAVDELRTIAPGPFRAVLGPCIHPARYEFGGDLLEPARRTLRRHGRRTHRDRQPRARRPAAVRAALRNAGVDELDDVGVCTAGVIGLLLVPPRRRHRPPSDARGARAVSVVDAVASVRARIDAAAARVGRDPSEVTLVAATKTVDRRARARGGRGRRARRR